MKLNPMNDIERAVAKMVAEGKTKTLCSWARDVLIEMTLREMEKEDE